MLCRFTLCRSLGIDHITAQRQNTQHSDQTTDDLEQGHTGAGSVRGFQNTVDIVIGEVILHLVSGLILHREREDVYGLVETVSCIRLSGDIRLGYAALDHDVLLILGGGRDLIAGLVDRQILDLRYTVSKSVVGTCARTVRRRAERQNLFILCFFTGRRVEFFDKLIADRIDLKDNIVDLLIALVGLVDRDRALLRCSR